MKKCITFISGAVIATIIFFSSAAFAGEPVYFHLDDEFRVRLGISEDMAKTINEQFGELSANGEFGCSVYFA